MRGLPTQGQRKASSTKPQSPTPADQTPSSSSQTRSSNASKSSSKKPKATPQETHKAVAKVREQLEANKDTGWLGNKWNSVKETIGSSPDPEKSWVTPKNLWAKVFNYDHSYEANEEKVAKLEARLAENPDAKIDAEELKAAKESIDTFAEAQVNAVDTITDIGLGVAVAAAVLAAVPTGGASLGFVAGAALIATPTSAAVKVAIKATNDWSAGDEYSRNELIYDALSGAAIGAAGALTFGAVSAVANRFVTKGITNKAVQFVAKEMAEGSVDGSVTGAISETARARYLKGQSWGQALSSGAQGALVGGSIGAVFQTGLSGAGKGAGTALRSLPVAGAVHAASEVADNLGDTLADAATDVAERVGGGLFGTVLATANQALNTATQTAGNIASTVTETITNVANTATEAISNATAGTPLEFAFASGPTNEVTGLGRGGNASTAPALNPVQQNYLAAIQDAQVSGVPGGHDSLGIISMNRAEALENGTPVLGRDSLGVGGMAYRADQNPLLHTKGARSVNLESDTFANDFVALVRAVPKLKEATAGRSPEAYIQFTGPGSERISRDGITLGRNNNTGLPYIYRETGTSPIFINGKKLSSGQYQHLHPGMKLQFGSLDNPAITMPNDLSYKPLPVAPEPQITLYGRGSEANSPINDPRMSGQHFQVKHSGGTAILTDLEAISKVG